MSTTRPQLRLASFLGEAAADHYRSVAALVAADAGVDIAALQEPGLARLEATLAEPGPALLFLCGLPYTRARDAGAAVAAIVAPAPDGQGGRAVYTSELVARAGIDQAALAHPDRLVLAYNGDDSLSGWVLPRSEFDLALYGRSVCSGSHRRSLQLLVAGTADVSAIDSTLRVLEGRRDPRIAALGVLERTHPVTSPPVVLLNGTTPLRLALQAAFARLHEHAAGRRALALGAVERYLPVDDADYDSVRALDAALPSFGC